jgi:hypothetical protein
VAYGLECDKLLTTLIRVEPTQDISLNSQPKSCDWNNPIKKIKRFIKFFFSLKKNLVLTIDLNDEIKNQ